MKAFFELNLELDNLLKTFQAKPAYQHLLYTLYKMLPLLHINKQIIFKGPRITDEFKLTMAQLNA